ncbi:MAG: PIN domain-containing protein [Thermaceae bacterium]|nr:PIN domain-containing protein [Thermaceae bacterium]
MSRVWGDANLLIRLITDDPPQMAAQAEAFLKRAEEGQFSVVLTPVTLAECVWVLSSFYGFSREVIAEGLGKLLTNTGLEVLEKTAMYQALEIMAEKNVDFIDAYLAAQAKLHDEPVASFDNSSV